MVLADYVCSSPIAESCGVTYSDDLDQVAHWEKLGVLLSQRLGHPSGDDASDQQRYCAAGQPPCSLSLLIVVAYAGHVYISTTFPYTSGCKSACKNTDSRILTDHYS